MVSLLLSYRSPAPNDLNFADHTSAGTDAARLQKLGSIEVEVYHLSSIIDCDESKTEDEDSQDEASEPLEPLDMTKISERSTKGKALSHAVG